MKGTIVIPIFNRPEMLLQCLSSIFINCNNFRIVIWNNNSTKICLDIIEDLKKYNKTNEIIIHNSDENIGVKGTSIAFEKYGTGDYYLTIDEDVLFVPLNFTNFMIHSFESVDKLGYLALNVVQDQLTNGAKPGPEKYTHTNINGKYPNLTIDEDVLFVPLNFTNFMIHSFESVDKLGYLALNVVQDQLTNGAKPGPEKYTHTNINGIDLELGPVGGWCTMVPSKLYNQVGGYTTNIKGIFAGVDGMLINKIKEAGYFPAILKNLYCYHATNNYYNETYGYTEILKNKYNDFFRN
jgi:glycosyltransferase involved in cell wall biosynthesis